MCWFQNENKHKTNELCVEFWLKCCWRWSWCLCSCKPHELLSTLKHFIRWCDTMRLCFECKCAHFMMLLKCELDYYLETNYAPINKWIFRLRLRANWERRKRLDRNEYKQHHAVMAMQQQSVCESFAWAHRIVCKWWVILRCKSKAIAAAKCTKDTKYSWEFTI